jgi:hypothetical protein
LETPLAYRNFQVLAKKEAHPLNKNIADMSYRKCFRTQKAALENEPVQKPL